jgi:hypothetical protein
MEDQPDRLPLLASLEARHDDLLARLEALDLQVEKVLAECLMAAKPCEAATSGAEQS